MAWLGLLPLLFIIIFSAIKILNEYERVVIFTLGKFTGVSGPGLIFVIPFIQQAMKVDMRLITYDIPAQDIISRDNITVKVNAVLYFKVVQPEKAIIQVEDFQKATSQLAQTTLRSVLGQHDLDDMLAERDKLNTEIQSVLDVQTDPWGVKVTNVELKHIDLDESMIRVIAKQAEAERERRAKIISSEGELQAAQNLLEAANTLSSTPEAMQLRYLQTLNNISRENASTIVFPFPTEIASWVKGFIDKK